MKDEDLHHESPTKKRKKTPVQQHHAPLPKETNGHAIVKNMKEPTPEADEIADKSTQE